MGALSSPFLGLLTGPHVLETERVQEPEEEVEAAQTAEQR